MDISLQLLDLHVPLLLPGGGFMKPHHVTGWEILSLNMIVEVLRLKNTNVKMKTAKIVKTQRHSLLINACSASNFRVPLQIQSPSRQVYDLIQYSNV